MRYLQSTPFSVQLGDKDAQKNYRDNWERTFRKPEEAPKRPPKKREIVVQHEAVAAR